MDDAREAQAISPINYLKILFRRKEYFIIPIFLGMILGICAGIVLPKKYRSDTTILVQEGKTDNPLFSQIAVSTTVKQRLHTIQETILGWDNLVRLVKRLNLDKDVKTPQDFENLILGIRENIIIKMRHSNVIDLGYIALDPVDAQKVVKNITEIFIERNVDIQNQETSDAITFIQQQLKVYQGKIESAKIAELEDQLNTLLIDSTESHPLVKKLRMDVNQKKQVLKEKNLEYTKSENISHTQTSNPIISEIQKALTNLEASAQISGGFATPESEFVRSKLLGQLDTARNKDRQVFARDVHVNEGIYNMLLQRLETAKITQRLQSSKEGTKYTIINPPRVPFSPFKPNKPLLVCIGLFLGTVLGAVLVILLEFLDKSFIDVEEAKDFLGVPLFGAISKITTEATLRQERERARWLYSLTFVSGIIIVIVTMAVSNFLIF